MNGWTWVAIGLGVSLLPIWRVAGGTQGLSVWGYLRQTNRGDFDGFPYPHIPYSEAVRRAQAAYRQVYGGQ